MNITYEMYNEFKNIQIKDSIIADCEFKDKFCNIFFLDIYSI